MTHQFKCGDKVRVVGAIDGNHKQWDHTNLFDYLWLDKMDEFLGMKLNVLSVSPSGVILDTGEGLCWAFPPQALELAEALDYVKIAQAMHKYGGSFVQKLAEAILAADGVNRDKLVQAFPELVKRYKDMT